MNNFMQWLIKNGYAHNTAYNYANAIRRISKHYSKSTGLQIDIYAITDYNELNNIASNYFKDGQYEEIGMRGNGTNRASLKKYLNFFNDHNSSVASEKNILTKMFIEIMQDAFPGHTIYEDSDIPNSNNFLLLKNENTKNFVAALIVSGKANMDAYSKICSSIINLENMLSEKKINGVIIAEAIDEKLKEAIHFSEKINVILYKIKMELFRNNIN